MNKKTVILIVLILGVIFISSCAPKPTQKCGDGICSPIEKEKDVCPQDCKPELPVKCGDGICGFVERQRGICPEDCKTTPTEKTCSQQNGDICTATETCSGSYIKASDTDRCCDKECQTAKTPEEINENSPFATNDFGIPSGVAKAVKITTKEQMTKEIEQGKIPLLEDIGVKWARQHPNYFGTFGWSGIDPEHDGQGMDFSVVDELVKLAQSHNIYILAGLSPLPFDTEWQTADTYIPQNKEAYSSYVKQTVERYDGDGKDDMPGLKYHIKYWQLENEPDLHNKFRKQRGNADFSSPEEYFEVLKLTYNAVKEADAESKVMLNVVGYGQNMGDTSVNYVQQLNGLGADNYYDIFSYHVYPTAYETSILTELLQKFKQLVGDKPIWITESGISGKLEIEEKEQAAWIIKHYISNIAGGVKKIVWLTFSDMSPNVPETTIAKYAGLTTFDSSTKKLSYYTYKKMVEVLEGSDWDNIQKIQESDGVYIYKFIKNNKPIWVAWNDNSAEQNVIISGISSSQIIVTEAVPKYESGKDVTDYNLAFNAETKSVSNNEVAITLGESPVFVEEK